MIETRWEGDSDQIVKEQPQNLGHQILYLLAFDLTIPNWYARLGWIHIGDDELFGHRVTVMSISI